MSDASSMVAVIRDSLGSVAPPNGFTSRIPKLSWHRQGSWSLFAALLLGLSALGQVPGMLNYQGKLAVGGIPFTGTCQFKFALVSAAGDRTFWSHNNTGASGSVPADPPVFVPVSHGLFSVNLGDVTVSNMTQAVPSTVFTNSNVYLRIWVNDGTNGWERLSPDSRVTSTAYAMVSENLIGPVPADRLPANVALIDASQTFSGEIGFTGPIHLKNPGNRFGIFSGNGSGLVNVTAVALNGIAPSAQRFTGSLSGDVTGTQEATMVNSIGGVSAGSVAVAAAAATEATSAGVPHTLVRRDSSGSFVAGTITGAFVGNGAGLTNLNAARLAGTLPSAVIESSVPPGLTVVSTLANDAGLIARGYQFTMTVAAPTREMPRHPVPFRRGLLYTALWDGQEMIIWGGDISTISPSFVNSGSMYHPDQDQWTAVSTVNPPSARGGHTAVWTGAEMIVRAATTRTDF